MRRGFVTIATGKLEYYELAYHLLVSYKYHTSNPLPFAILCEKKNRFTDAFDDVVLIDAPRRAFTDKLRILDLSPYEETIFIDADSLAYSDLNGLWDLFRDAPPFGLIGETVPLDSERAWLSLDNTGVFRDAVEKFIICQGGIYYVRKDCPEDFKATARYILEHYYDFDFRVFRVIPCDETILSLACSVHKIYPSHNLGEVFCYYPKVRKVHQMDIRKGELEYEYIWQEPGGTNEGRFLVHWGTRGTRGWVYARELERLISSSRHQGFNPFRLLFRYVRSFLRTLPSRFPYSFKSYIFKILHPQYRYKN